MFIKEIAKYHPESFEINYDFKEKFNLDDSFIKNKLGIDKRYIAKDDMQTSDLCVEAFKNLKNTPNLGHIDCIILITQNPDYKIPHTSAIIQKKLNLSTNVACFDISLGCSGYIYGLSIIKSFMTENSMKTGLLFTADPYSKIINKNDKDTKIIFSDAASVTLITSNPKEANFEMINFEMGTNGNYFDSIIYKNNFLEMNGNKVLNFTIREVPKLILNFLDNHQIEKNTIDHFFFHQASKYILDYIEKFCKLKKEQVPSNLENYGNTVSSSIPILFNEYFNKSNEVILCGFGVGLSYGICYLKRIDVE